MLLSLSYKTRLLKCQNIGIPNEFYLFCGCIETSKESFLSKFQDVTLVTSHETQVGQQLKLNVTRFNCEGRQ